MFPFGKGKNELINKVTLSTLSKQSSVNTTLRLTLDVERNQTRVEGQDQISNQLLWSSCIVGAR